MLRRFAAGFLSVSALIPGTLFGLGLGDAQLDSYLNQPLEAKIELQQTRGLTPQEIIVNLGSPKDFSQAGVDRSFFLSTLKFEVRQNQNGVTSLYVTSRRPVTEPFLNFLVEVQWPAGRMLREYTLLLDPPEFKQELPLAIRAAKQQPSSQVNTSENQARVQPGQMVTDSGVALDNDAAMGDSTRDDTQDGQSELDESNKALEQESIDEQVVEDLNEMSQEPEQTQPIANSTQPVQPQTYTVQSGDNLSKIMQNIGKVGGGSRSQELAAYQYLNPQAFINNNINLIKRGAELTIPTIDDVRRLSRQEAAAEISAQNQAWRAKIKARDKSDTTADLESRRLDGSDRDVTPQEAPEVAEEGRLSLVSSDATSSGADAASGKGESTAGSEVGSLTDQLAIQSEETEKYGVANSNLKDELAELDELSEKTDRILTMKNEQIATLNAQLEKMAQAEGDTPNEEMATTSSNDIFNEELSGDFIEKDSSGMENVDNTETELPDAEPVDEEITSDVDVSEMEDPFAQNDETTESESKDLLTIIRENAIYIGGGSIVFLGLLIWLARRNRDDDDDDDDDDDEYEDLSATHEESFDETFDNTMESDGAIDTSHLSDDISTDSVNKQLLEAGDDLDIDTVLSEADIYLAYGRFPQAIEMLRNGLRENPQSTGLNLKLLEVYAESKDEESFKLAEEHLRSFADDDTVAMINAIRIDAGWPVGDGPVPESAGAFEEEETQLLEEGQSNVLDEAEDYLSLADIEAELDVGHNFGEDVTHVDRPKNEFAAEETQVTTAPSEEDDFSDLDLDLDLGMDDDNFSPEDALADIDNDIEGFDLDLNDTDLNSLNLDNEDDALLTTDSEFNAPIDKDTLAEDSSTQESESLDLELDTSYDTFDLDGVPEAIAGDQLSPVDDDTLSTNVTANGSHEDSLSDTNTDDNTASSDPFGDSDLDASSLDEVNLASEPVRSLSDNLASDPKLEDDLAETDSNKQTTSPRQFDSNLDDEDDFSMLDGVDEISTKMDLARAYIDMGDREGAKEILDEVMLEGTDDQQEEARQLLQKLG